MSSVVEHSMMKEREMKEWIGKSVTASDEITATPYSAMLATLDRPPYRPENGVALPPLWHWLYFLPLYRQSELGPDGHAKKGGFLPPISLPRRMWAGGQFVFHHPLCVGDAVTRTSTIDDIISKTGRSGELVFVKVRHDIRAGRSEMPAITEFHDIVYRDAPKATDVPLPSKPAPASDFERQIVPDDVLLFRYSALTFNGHRIHYDRRYVTEVEGYPGLIVHGPLLATLLLDLLLVERPGTSIERFEFKALRPVFDIHPFYVCGKAEPDGKTFRLWVKNHENAITMEATAVAK
jgi:3-methylfumaryl-CoA hydratase